LLVDGRSLSLSLIVSAANRHDVSPLQAVLGAIMIERPSPPIRGHKHLCADAGYTGALALKVTEAYGYIPRFKGRGQEAEALKRDPEKKVMRWVVEVVHSWFNRLRKLLVRYEKLERSFLALKYLAASPMALRKIKSGINIIYGGGFKSEVQPFDYAAVTAP
jgi:transposase